ncbi:MAG: hypothetical protein DMD85_00185 [Candidatus Rokuibacteriota bacterium]|nr:MAG: hypothetical protein DMD85_00185 [Candidatus Rokubacteria bacterium]
MLGTDAFLSLARATSAKHGLPHMPVALVPHPLGGIPTDTARAKADAILDEVLRGLTSDPTPPATTAAARPTLVEAPEDLDAFQLWAMEQEWSDGLPVLPPTEARVAKILGRRAGEELASTLMPLDGRATLHAIAVNAALAGAGPEHLPVIIAAVRAVATPQFNLNAIQCTTHPCSPLVIVNGPIAARLGVAGGPNALGNGHRANAVIGRALRLVLQNVGGARPGREDRATLGHPGKFTYCLAENEAQSPWEPLHVERGFAREDSTVTVCGSEPPHNVNDHGSTTGETLMAALAGTAATTGSNNIYLAGDPLVILGPEHAQTLASSGWSKQDFQRRFWDAARVPMAKFSADNIARFKLTHPERFENAGPDTLLPFASKPEDVMVIVAGGPGKHSAIVPTFGATRSVTERIEA